MQNDHHLIKFNLLGQPLPMLLSRKKIRLNAGYPWEKPNEVLSKRNAKPGNILDRSKLDSAQRNAPALLLRPLYICY